MAFEILVESYSTPKIYSRLFMAHHVLKDGPITFYLNVHKMMLDHCRTLRWYWPCSARWALFNKLDFIQVRGRTLEISIVQISIIWKMFTDYRYP